MNFKVKCIRAKKTPEGKSIGFTTGEIYKVENGKIIDNDGIPRPVMNNDTINSVDDIRTYKMKDCGEWGWIGVFEEVQNSRSTFNFIGEK